MDGWFRRYGRSGQRRAGLGLALALAVAVPASAAPAPPLVVRYEAYAAGFPMVAFDFRLDQTGEGYVVGGQIRSVGLLRLFYSLAMRTESEGAIAAESLHPRSHETSSRARGKDRLARLDYPGDGTVSTRLVPPDDSGRPKPTPEQIAGTIDPLTAILAIGRAVARDGRCGGRFAIFDGRRRYDLVLGDDGAEPAERAAGYALTGELRRCTAAAVKIAGFSFDQDYSPHTTNGEVWFAVPRPGAPALPVRIDFGSSWGFVTVRMTAIDPEK
jgi:hypothetical protein